MNKRNILCLAILLGSSFWGRNTFASTPTSFFSFPIVNQVSPNPLPNKPPKKTVQRKTEKNRASPNQIKRLARKFIQALRFRQLEEAHGMLAPKLKKAIPSQRLQGIWMAIQMRMGTFQKIDTIRAKPFRQFFFATVTCSYSRKPLAWLLIFNRNLQIVGFRFRRATASKKRKRAHSKPLPSYIHRHTFVEKPVVVQAKQSPWKLAGTLSLPKGKRPVAAVVLVHGSGPLDQDESIGGSKVFRDIAWGLASRGIAVLRYTKRTKAMSHMTRKMSRSLRRKQVVAFKENMTVEKEVIDDAVAAIQLLKKTKGIDPNKIFVYGHSLGAMMAPAIAKRVPSVAGLIMMGVPSRSLTELVLDQTKYIFMLDGKLTASEKQIIRKLTRLIASIKSNNNKKSQPRLLGLSPRYLQSVERNAAIHIIEQVKQPVFLLQGGRDYQVTMVDFEGWKKKLKGRPHTKRKVYPSLNHLFIAGKGKSTPREYLLERHLAKQVIMDVAEWIKTQKTTPTTVPTSAPTTMPTSAPTTQPHRSE